MNQRLNDAAIGRLKNRLIHALSQGPMRAPMPGEQEPAFTKSVLQPIVREVIAPLGVPGLILTGDGGDRTKPSLFYGLWFRLDLGLLYKRQTLIGVEVKFLRASGRQVALAAAIGQAVIYSTEYPETIVLLVDLAPNMDAALSKHAAELLEDRSGISLIARRKFRNELLPHPTQ